MAEYIHITVPKGLIYRDYVVPIVFQTWRHFQGSSGLPRQFLATPPERSTYVTIRRVISLSILIQKPESLTIQPLLIFPTNFFKF